MKCIKCGNKLTGKQTRFCSRKCNGRYTNGWFNTAKKQKKKGIDRKLELMKMLGKIECIKCGYRKNLACLSFHHKNPKEKEFGLDQRICSMYSMKRLINEAKKCDVLCMNCHTEHHNPNHELVGPEGLEPTTKKL